MSKRMLFVSLLICCSGFSCSKQGAAEPAADFTTPEGAILCLEKAYRDRDIEKAVACKDFYLEAREMLADIASENNDQTLQSEEIIKQTAEVLELSFRSFILEDGFPDFDGLSSSFPEKVKVKDDVYRVTEVCKFPDGGTSRQVILVGFRNGEWKVLNSVD